MSVDGKIMFGGRFWYPGMYDIQAGRAVGEAASNWVGEYPFEYGTVAAPTVAIRTKTRIIAIAAREDLLLRARRSVLSCRLAKAYPRV